MSRNSNPSSCASQQVPAAAERCVGPSPMEASSPTDGRERDKMCGISRRTAAHGEGAEEDGLLFGRHATGGKHCMSDGEEGDKSPASYAAIAAGRKSPFVFSSAGGASRKRICLGSSEDRKPMQHMEIAFPALDVSRDLLVSLCRASKEGSTAGSRIKVSLSIDSVSEGLHTLKSFGVMLYFMGRILSEQQLKEWARASVGVHAFSKFIFLGKGIYLAICSEHQVYYDLISRVGIKGHGFFALALPWDPNFDPLQEFLKFCPVWINLLNFPVFLLPYLEKIANAFGKVLFLPKFDYLVPSRNIRLCVLWEMAKPIPAALEIDLGLEDSYFIAVKFNSFPHACYKCHQVGHFARDCTSGDPKTEKRSRDFSSSPEQAVPPTVSKNGNVPTIVFKDVSVPVHNTFEVLADASIEISDPISTASQKDSQIVNLEEGHTLFVDLQMEAAPQVSYPSMQNPIEPKKTSKSQVVRGREKKEFSVDASEAEIVKQNNKENHSVKGKKQESSQPLGEKSNVTYEVIESKIEERKTQSSVLTVKPLVKDATYEENKQVVIKSQGKLMEKGNIEGEWNYDPPTLPNCFGYFDWKKGKYKIKGRVEDTSFGKKIHFRNSKIRSVKSFLQEFQLRLEDLIFLDSS